MLIKCRVNSLLWKLSRFDLRKTVRLYCNDKWTRDIVLFIRLSWRRKSIRLFGRGCLKLFCQMCFSNISLPPSTFPLHFIITLSPYLSMPFPFFLPCFFHHKTLDTWQSNMQTRFQNAKSSANNYMSTLKPYKRDIMTR